MDRRSNPRKYLRLRAIVEVPSGRKPIRANVLDISLGGAFIEIESLLRVSALLIIEFRLPDSRPQNTFRLYAKVAHRTATGLGLAFLSMPAATRHALNAALSRLPRADSDPTTQLSVAWIM